MKPSKKKVEVKELNDEAAIQELAEAVVESLRHDYHSELEPFEVYAQKIRGRIYDSVQEYRKRFVNGYEVLLKEIENEKGI